MTIKILLAIILDWQMIIIALSAVVYIWYKDKPALIFSVVTLISFLISYFGTPFIFDLDPGRVYRYVFWITNDVAWMAIIAYLGIKDKISINVSIVAQICVIPIVLIQLLRIVDIQILDIPFITLLYKTIIPLSNTLIVLLCLWPFLSYLIERVKLLFFKMSDVV